MTDRRAERLSRAFYARDAPEVARALLGQVLVHQDGAVRRAARIVETEAYHGPDDRASHARAGPTPRAAIMFGPPGVAYVYLIYGLIALEFLLGLMGASASNGFVQFIGALTRPLLAPFERIVGTPSSGAFQVRISYLFALVVYVLIHLAINGAFRLVAHRKVTV